MYIESTQSLSVQLNEFSQGGHIYTTSTQIKKSEDLAGWICCTFSRWRRPGQENKQMDHWVTCFVALKQDHSFSKMSSHWMCPIFPNFRNEHIWSPCTYLVYNSYWLFCFSLSLKISLMLYYVGARFEWMWSVWLLILPVDGSQESAARRHPTLLWDNNTLNVLSTLSSKPCRDPGSPYRSKLDKYQCPEVLRKPQAQNIPLGQWIQLSEAFLSLSTTESQSPEAP